jgi:hypothetical protein
MTTEPTEPELEQSFTKTEWNELTPSERIVNEHRNPNHEHWLAQRAAGDNIVPLTAYDDEDAPTYTRTTWAHVDMTEALTHQPIEPKYLEYGQNLAAFYPGKTHTLYAASESGKSWVALYAVAQILLGDDNGTERVLYIDHEDDARSIAERLAALCVPDETITNEDRFRYINPAEPLTDQHNELYGPAGDYLHLALEWSPTFVVIDGVSEAMTEEGLDPISNSHVAEWFRIVARRFEKIGAAVVMIDHTAKSHGEGPPTEIGAQHKRAGISGASFLIDAVKRPGRAVLGEPVEGLLRLRLAKDRAGYHRGRYRGDYPVVAELTITSYPDGGVTVHADEHNETEGTSPLAIEIAVFLSVMGQSSKSAISEGIGKSRTDNTAAKELADMVKRKEVVWEPGPSNSKQHDLTDHGRDVYSAHLEEKSTNDETTPVS